MSELAYKAGNGQCGLSVIGRSVLMIMTLWFASIVAMAVAGVFSYSAGQRPVAILLAFSMPGILFLVAYRLLPAFRQWVLALDRRRLILLHSWRMIGMGFIFLYFQDRLPALFAFPAGLGDAMTAVGAVIIAIALYEGNQAVTRRRIFLWNSFGLLDFFVAVSLGVLTRTGDLLYTAGQPSSDIMGSFPQAVVPGFFVPFYIITHLIIFLQLRANQED